ncbi:NUDIX hydrolase [Planomonospora sp. ID82291]|uniref:NUDIX hydrolase n=1 Tax=Planomonospora sp. ID82291 TaxID=2738136 RepID=UPI0018C3F7D1|nr:NUDIX hydrolase [Planomonospora sp. ID82291]MBG0818419.1 NUDIX hydrolase [Planomonospora sp. ID82291]
MTDAASPSDTATGDTTAGVTVGVAAFDAKGRILLLRQAPGNILPGLWEIPQGPVAAGQSPEQAARRALRDIGLADVQAATYAGHLDYLTPTDSTRQVVVTTRVEAHHLRSTGITLPPGHDASTWRHADALPAVSAHALDLIRRIAPPKPLLDPEEWQNALPRWHVGANALVRDQHGRILIVRPTRSRTWQLPGGQVDAHETPQDAAGRELREETGLGLPVGALLAISFEHPSPGWDHPTQILLFDLGIIDSAAARITAHDPDIAEHRWAHPEEAEHLLGPARTQRLRAGFLGIRQGHPVLLTITDPEI